MKDIVDQLTTHPDKEYPTRLPSAISTIVVHHAATPTTVTPEQIARYHVETRGWPGIGYHFCVTTGGHVYQTNRLHTMSYHAKDANPYSVGICLIGDFTDRPPTQLHLTATRQVIEYTEERLGRDLEIVGHKEAVGADTACPGDTWLQWKNQIMPVEEEATMSKLGVHFQGPPERTPGAENDVTEIVRASKIGVIKGIDVGNWPQLPAELFPGKRVFARFWIGGDQREQQEFMAKGREGAENYFYALIGNRYDKLLNWGVKDFLGPNEPHPWNVDQFAAYQDFYIRWIELCKANGIRPWIWSWGVGWPDIDTGQLFAESVQAAIDAGGGMEVHEYGAPEVMSGSGWWTLRYRRTVEELRRAGVEFPADSILIGECGIDGGVIDWTQEPWNSKRRRRGWHEWADNWVYPEQYGLPAGLLTAERYFRQLRAYDKELGKDDYVLAATPFVTIPFGDWSDFNVGHETLKRFAEAHEQEPEPTPEPPEDDLEQRVADLEAEIEKFKAWLDQSPL